MEIFKKFAKYSWMLDILKGMDKEDRNNFLAGYKRRKQYYTMDNVTANLKDMLKCANCPNMCRFDCPPLQVTKKETYSPAKKAQLAYFAGMGHLSDSDPSVRAAFYACTTCDACREWCPMDISVGDLLVQMRQRLAENGTLPPAVVELGKKVSNSGTIFAENVFQAAPDEFKVDDPRPEVFFYIGCMDIKHRPETVRATINLLKHLGIPFTTKLEDRQCCGGPVYKAGLRALSLQLAENNADLLKNSHVKAVITNCPGCLSSLHKIYADLDVKLHVEVMHAVEFFSQKIREKKLILNPLPETTITFHDPCLIARRSSTKDHVQDFRDLFAQVPGLSLKEVPLHGHETRCCGMGGAYGVSNPDNAQNLHVDRLAQLESTGADWIVSACPTCEYAFDAAYEMGNGSNANTHLPIRDFVEVLWDSVKEK